ncbi:MAG: hypothetical protein JWO31_605, partial [Phycisphaerales bacterium]|nr:hypothetical protein [Phycisphaerales bacterium]
MAKRKNSTALFEVMAASRAARMKADAAPAQPLPPPATAASRGSATRSPYAPPPGVARAASAGPTVSSAVVAMARRWAAGLAERGH